MPYKHNVILMAFFSSKILAFRIVGSSHPSSSLTIGVCFIAFWIV